MGKLVAKTALCTLSVLIGLALIVFGALSLAAPSAMLAFSDDLGMDKLSAAYSVAVYERTEEIEDLVEAVERNYNVSNYNECAKYGAKLLADSDFGRYCAARDQQTAGNDNIHKSYSQYISGIVSTAQYYTGEEEAALNTAFSALGQTFPKYNAVKDLTVSARIKDDKIFCGQILERLQDMKVEDSQEQELLRNFISDLADYCTK